MFKKLVDTWYSTADQDVRGQTPDTRHQNPATSAAQTSSACGKTFLFTSKVTVETDYKNFRSTKVHVSEFDFRKSCPLVSSSMLHLRYEFGRRPLVKKHVKKQITLF